MTVAFGMNVMVENCVSVFLNSLVVRIHMQATQFFYFTNFTYQSQAKDSDTNCERGKLSPARFVRVP